MTRGEKPQCILSIENKVWNKGWYGKQVEILSCLLKETNGYCAFSYALIDGEHDDDEIEHFRPKNGKFRNKIFEEKKFSELYFEWLNLFPITSKRNKIKGSRWDERLSKPDVDNYLDFFDFTESDGTLQIKPNLNDYDVKRAEITIKLYGLNAKQICSIRKTQYKKFLNNRDDKIPFKPLFLN